VDAGGSAAAPGSALTARLRKERRPILLLDVFQTGAAKAPRKSDPAAGVNTSLPADADEEDKADAAAGGAKFYTFNVADDAARVQDLVTAIVYASRSGNGVDLYAGGDAALWAVFAAAVSDVPVSLHSEDMPQLKSDADYLKHFNVPGILRAGGLPVAEQLAEKR
jgi:hypothetical protein